MTPDAERAAFMRAILEQPNDDTPRLVFADWLQEHGEPDRAEFIRLQIEIARLGQIGPEEARKAANIIARFKKGAPVRLTAKTPATMLAKEQLLLEKTTLAEHGLSTNWIRWFMGSPVESFGFNPRFNRGFVDDLNSSTVSLLSRGKAVMFAHPIQFIRLELIRIEIDPPGAHPEDASCWQAYFFEHGEEVYYDMNGWETREEMISGVLAHVKERPEVEYQY